MAKYISAEVVNAAQWDPANTTPMQEMLAEFKNKIKEVKIVQTIKGSKLDTEGCLEPANASLVVTPSSGSAVTVDPTSYLVRKQNGIFNALSEKRFNEQYKLQDDGTAEPVDPEDPKEEDPKEEDPKPPATPSWSTGSIAQTKTNLRSQLMAGNKVLNETVVSTDGSDVATNKYWYKQADKDALQQSVNLANSVNDDANATQDEVDGATEILKTAVATAKAARKNGTGTLSQAED